jgi:MoxR-like ATPase
VCGRPVACGGVTIEVTSEAVTAALHEAIYRADEIRQGQRQPDPEWLPRLEALYGEKRLTYWPVLCVTLIARVASPDVDVRKIQKQDRPDAYAATSIGQALIKAANAAEVDMRTDSSNVLNSQPFTFKGLITPDLTGDVAYPAFFAMVEDVQLLSSDQAREVLATAFYVGMKAWPTRTRRGQKSPAYAATPATEGEAFFILSQSPHEDFAHYDAESFYGFHARVTSAKALVDAGSGQFVLYRTHDGSEHPMSFVGRGRVSHVEEASEDDRGRKTWRAYISDYTPFAVPVLKSDGAPARWNAQNSIARIDQAAFERIVKLGGGMAATQPLTAEALQERCQDQGVVLPSSVLVAMVSAVNAGKHLVLTGPPGTAKTTVAVELAMLAAELGHCSGSLLTTATSDWSTYDTIGGLRPSVRQPGLLEFAPGHFTEAVDQRQWLVVDEMNRANFDRAFGQLFTVLAGQSVVLPYRDAESGKPVRFRLAAHAADPQFSDIVVGETWRMIGTLNNFDKSLLYEMSFALMRRFAFVEVPAPDPATFRALIRQQVVDCTPEVASQVESVVGGLLALRDLKDLGPALFIDAARYARELLASGSLTDGEAALLVFYGMLLPQFEGVDETTGRRLLKAVVQVAGATQREAATRMLRSVLGLELRSQSDLDAEAALDDAAEDAQGL